MANDQNASRIADRISLHRNDLEQLAGQLREANQRCIEAAKPLNRVDELNLQQRYELAQSIQATNRRWEEVTSLIRETMTSVTAIFDETES